MAIGPIVRGLSAPGHAPDAASPPATTGGGLPRPGWPAKHDLDYLKVAIELALLILAVPWLVHRLLTRPAATARRAGEAHLK